MKPCPSLVNDEYSTADSVQNGDKADAALLCEGIEEYIITGPGALVWRGCWTL